MSELKSAAAEFLSHRRIAVAGVSRDRPNAGNVIYRRLRQEGYQVFAVNPHADVVEGDRCFHALDEIEGGVDGVVITTPPDAAPDVVRECVQTGTPRVWLHRSFGKGSASEEAAALCEKEGVTVINGACPRMYIEPIDVAHRCFRWYMGVTGKRPRMS
jgi:predicted CoA-binding protein